MAAVVTTVRTAEVCASRAGGILTMTSWSLFAMLLLITSELILMSIYKINQLSSDCRVSRSHVGLQQLCSKQRPHTTQEKSYNHCH